MNDIMRYFEYKHLPGHLQTVSKPICELAAALNMLVPNSTEKYVGMRKLLEAKDCFVRSAVAYNTETIGNPHLKPAELVNEDDTLTDLPPSNK